MHTPPVAKAGEAAAHGQGHPATENKPALGSIWLFPKS